MIRFTSEKEFKICDSTTLRKLASMRRHGVMTDLTLICGTSLYPVHKLVLAASSNHYNETYFTKKNGKVQKQSTILIPDVDPVDLENLITYMYSGQLVIPENELPGLMRVSNTLRIDGLKEEYAVRVPVYNLVPLKSSAKPKPLTLPRNDRKLRSTMPAEAGKSRESRRLECQDTYQTPTQNYRRSLRNDTVKSQSHKIVSKTPCRNDPLNDRNESVESKARFFKHTRTERRQTPKVVTIRDNSSEKYESRKTTGTLGTRENSFENSTRHTTNVRKSTRKSNFHFKPIMSSTLLVDTPRPYTVEKLKTPAPAMPAKDNNNTNAQVSNLSRRSRPRISSVAQKALSDNVSAMRSESYIDRKIRSSKLHNETVIIYNAKVTTEKTPLKRDRIGEVKSARTPCQSTPAQSQIRTTKTPKVQNLNTPAQRTATGTAKVGKSDSERSIHKFRPLYSSTLLSEVGGITGRSPGLGKLRPAPPSPKNPRPLKRLKCSENPIPIETQVKSRLSRGRPRKSCRNPCVESVDLISTEEELTEKVDHVNPAVALKCSEKLIPFETKVKSRLSRGRPRKSCRNPRFESLDLISTEEELTKNIDHVNPAVASKYSEKIIPFETKVKSRLSRGRPRKSYLIPEIDDTNSTGENEKSTKNIGSIAVAVFGEKNNSEQKVVDTNLASIARKSALSRGRPRKPCQKLEIEDTNSTEENIEPPKSVASINNVALIGENKGGRQKKVDNDINLAVEKRRYYNTRASKRALQQLQSEEVQEELVYFSKNASGKEVKR